MHMGGWIDLGKSALALIHAQPIQYQVFSWLAVAFVVVMFLEGIRSSFYKRRNYD
jgi:hypothetical protein